MRVCKQIFKKIVAVIDFTYDKNNLTFGNSINHDIELLAQAHFKCAEYN